MGEDMTDLRYSVKSDYLNSHSPHMIKPEPRYSMKTDVLFSDTRNSIKTNRSERQFSGYQQTDPFSLHFSTSTTVERQRSPKSVTIKDQSGFDMKEELLRQQLADAGVHQKIENLGGGYYKVGTKKIYTQMHNGRVLVKTANGFMEAEDYIEMYLTSNSARGRIDTDVMSMNLDRSILGNSFGGSNSLNRSMGSIGGGKSMTL